MPKVLKLKRKELQHIITEYSKLYTCAVSDAIDELGLEPGYLDADFRPVWPGARMVGFAGIIKMVERFVGPAPKATTFPTSLGLV